MMMVLSFGTFALADAGSEPDWTGYNDLIAKIKSETDMAERVTLMHQAEDQLMDTGAIIPIYYYNDIYMREVPVAGVAEIITKQLRNGGVFLCADDGKRSNVMTIGWGGLNVFFGDYCFLAPVRKSRFSYGLLQKNGAFTISVPLKDMRAELNFAGTKSGRDMASALKLGNRTMMMEQGEIILDIAGEERDRMQVDDLLKRYAGRQGKQLDNDRMLLSR